MTLNLTRPLVVLDVETTGLEPDIDRIVQIGLVTQPPGGVIQQFQSLVNPGCPIPPEVTEIHGITDEAVKDAESFPAVWSRVAELLEGADLCAYNARFDLSMIEAECKRNGIPWEPPARVIDPLLIFRAFHPHTLVGAVRHYCGREHEDAHSAMGDVLATLEVLEKQSEAHGLASVEQLIEASQPAKNAQWVDATRKFYWRFGAPVFAFGKHRGRPLAEVVNCDSSYLDWMLRQDYGLEVDELIRNALRGRIPSRPKPGA